MHDRVQFESCGSGEVRVQPQHVDCELHLVDHALAGAVAARKEFKIFNLVVLPVAVAVMHGFFWVKLSAQMLLHYVTVLKSFARRISIFSRDYNSDISIFLHSCCRLLLWMFLLIRKSAKQRSAFCTTKAFLPIYCAAGLALNWHRFSALDTCGLPFFLGKLAPYSTAFCGTILRLFIPFFYVCANCRRFVTKIFAANFTLKIYIGYSRIFASKNAFVRSFAFKITKALRRISWANFEGFSAAFTNFVDRHWYLHRLTTRGAYHGCLFV